MSADALVDGGEGSVGGVASGGDADEGGARGEAGGVVDRPPSALECLEDGVKVHGEEPRRVDRGEPGRESRGPAQRDAEVGEIPAGAHAGQAGCVRPSRARRWIPARS